MAWLEGEEGAGVCEMHSVDAWLLSHDAHIVQQESKTRPTWSSCRSPLYEALHTGSSPFFVSNTLARGGARVLQHAARGAVTYDRTCKCGGLVR